jgi:RNA polymerase sigma-70 factor (ECF subfamily)
MSGLTEETEKMLVGQMKNDDARAFDQLFRKYSPRLFRFAFSLQKSNEDAREIVQETFYRIWTRRHELDVEKSFKSFVFTISYNLIVDQLRLRLKDQEYRRFIYRKFNLDQEPPPIKADYEILYRQIDQAIEELPEKRKAVFILSRRRGMSHREIADEMGISVKTVENQINLSLKHLRMRLGKDILPVLLLPVLLILALLP